MKVLVVCSGNVPNFDFKIHQAFIYEQIESLKKYHSIEYDTFFINGKGISGYLRNLPSLKKKLKEYKPDLIHAHFGISALLANLQRRYPVVTTLHGSDLNLKNVRIFSLFARVLSKATIFVSDKMLRYVSKKENDYVIPCGVNMELFFPLNQSHCRNQLNWKQDKIYILFSSSFDNPVKNFSLAQQSLDLLGDDIELIELKNKRRHEVNILLNASNFLLLTSFSEGSPQIIKEAMACNCPIVATDVGDIKEIISGTEGCYITSFDSHDVATKIKMAIEFSKTKGRTNGREKIQHLDNKLIAEKIINIYKKVLHENL